MMVSTQKYLVLILLCCILADSGPPVSNTSLTTLNFTQPSWVVLSGKTYTNESDSPQASEDDIWNITWIHNQIPQGRDELLARLSDIEMSFSKYYYPFMIVLSVFGSIATIIILQKGALRSSVSAYIRGIACVNLIVLFQYSMSSLRVSKHTSSSLPWRNFFACFSVFSVSLSFINLAANAWIVIALAVERLIAVYKPLKARIICSEPRAKKIVCGIYVMSVLVNSSRFFSLAVRSELDPVTNNTVLVMYRTRFGNDPLHNKIESLFFSISAVIVPVVLLGILNILIIVKLRLRRKQQRMLKEGMTAGTEDASKKQVERVLVATVSAFFVGNSVAATVVFSVALHGPAVMLQFDYRVRRFIMSILYILNPFFNFVLYVCCSQIMQKGVKDLFCLREYACK